MFLKRCLFYAALFLAFATHELFAKGAQIVVHLKNGKQVAGELHSVSDSSLVVSWRETGAEHISEVSTKEIWQVVMKNKPQVVLLLKNGRQMTGKLHGVSDSSVIIFIQGSVSSVASKTEVRNHEIQGATIKGKSNVLKGMGLGLLAGTVTGAAIGGIAAGQADNPVEDLFAPLVAVAYAAYGGMAGLAVGGIAGAATSTSSQEIVLAPGRPFLFLKPLARYPERGPEDKW
jgi:small nuclear ribonucleoprotein (snRNP)-like protein